MTFARAPVEVLAQFRVSSIWHRLRSTDDAMMRRPRTRMTVAQLKQHMDRRFDHLDRTKADKSDLSRFVTKDDLKAELQRFATRDEMTRQFAVVFRRLDSLNDKIDSLVGVVRDNRDMFDRVSDEYGHRISDLEHDIGGHDAGVPKA